ncbi:MAG: hypothetical protein ACYC0L_08250 [Thermoleophilia bacterium]
MAGEISNPFEDIPARVIPYITLDDLNQPVPAIPGPFRIVGGSLKGILESDLVFRWVPSRAVTFEGSCSLPSIDLETQWFLESDDPSFKVPVLITSTALGPVPTTVRGILREPLSLGDAPFEVLRFSLANFPDYIGAPVRYEQGDSNGGMLGRLHANAGAGECRVDVIPEASDLRKAAERDSGFVISHVGEWLPSSGRMTVAEAEATLDMLHIWFGLLRGAWSGPIFPQGCVDDEVVWRRFAAWNLDESRDVTTWMPQRTPLDLSEMFTGFLERWNDPAWQSPLRCSVSWFVEANSPGTALESRIILAQVALELMAWVQLVEIQQLHSRSAFKRLSAAGRIRDLLQQIGVTTAVPDYMTHLPSLYQGDAFDGPGVITRVRNALVHATEDNRSVIGSLDGITWHECSQLALQYIELVLLAICGHNGHYARRAWKGWKGDDEVLVPWVATG